MLYPSSLEYTFGADWRNGVYVPRNKHTVQIVATVDVYFSKREVLMHNEIDDVPFCISPQKLRKEWKRI